VLRLARPPHDPRIAREHKRWFSESVVYDVLAETKNGRWIRFNALAGFAFTLIFIIATQISLLLIQFRHSAVLGLFGTLMALTVIAAQIVRFFSSFGDGDAAIVRKPSLFYGQEDTDT
jgi:predicted membrane channel-forming protein YqfA (hemolysin III family)